MINLLNGEERSSCLNSKNSNELPETYPFIIKMQSCEFIIFRKNCLDPSLRVFKELQNSYFLKQDLHGCSWKEETQRETRKVVSFIKPYIIIVKSYTGYAIMYCPILTKGADDLVFGCSESFTALLQVHMKWVLFWSKYQAAGMQVTR